MKAFCVIILLIFTNEIFGQHSQLYRDDGKLLFDTSYSISKVDLEKLNKFEKYILPDIFNKLVFPNEASDVSTSGKVVVKITILENDVKSSVANEGILNEWDRLLVNAAKESITNSKSDILEWSKDIIKPVQFFIPFEFKIIDQTFESELQRAHALIKMAQGGAGYFERIDGRDRK